jgi:hypothetical protein
VRVGPNDGDLRNERRLVWPPSIEACLANVPVPRAIETRTFSASARGRIFVTHTWGSEGRVMTEMGRFGAAVLRTGSLIGGALGGLSCIGAAIAFALWATGHVETFTRNRGMLQLLVAIPASCLLTSALLAGFGILSPAQLYWTLAPVVAAVVLGVWIFGSGFADWSWMVGLGLPVLVPWLLGVWLGSLVRRAREKGRTGESR